MKLSILVKKDTHLNEIERIGIQGDDVNISNSDINFNSKKQVATVDNLPIYQYNLVDGGNIMFCIEIDEKIVSMISGVNQDKNFYILRTFTDSRYSGKGYATALYKALFSNLNFTLVSNKDLSPPSITIWKKLSKIFNGYVKFYDMQTHKEFPFTDDESTQFYNDSRYRIVLENSFVEPNFLSESREIYNEYVLYIGENAAIHWKNLRIELL